MVWPYISHMDTTTAPITRTISLSTIAGLDIVECDGYYAIVNRDLGNVEYVKSLKVAEAVLVSVAQDKLAAMLAGLAA
jgi:hypothetical protein